MSSDGFFKIQLKQFETVVMSLVRDVVRTTKKVIARFNSKILQYYIPTFNFVTFPLWWNLITRS